MSGLIGGEPKPVQPPKPIAPAAIPEVGEEVGDIAKRKRPRGRAETFLTGDLVPETKKKTLLG